MFLLLPIRLVTIRFFIIILYILCILFVLFWFFTIFWSFCIPSLIYFYKFIFLYYNFWGSLHSNVLVILKFLFSIKYIIQEEFCDKYCF